MGGRLIALLKSDCVRFTRGLVSRTVCPNRSFIANVSDIREERYEFVSPIYADFCVHCRG
jgi:hypothetical protein